MMHGGAGRVTDTGFRPEVPGFESRTLHFPAVTEVPVSAAHVLTFPAVELDADETITHEAFVHAVRDLVVQRVQDEATRERLLAAKLVYGAGPAGVRGLCYYGSWENGARHDFIEITAVGEESNVQLVGTTIHELGHALAHGGHGREWKAACAVLGLKVTSAAGQAYAPEHFDADVWAAVEAMPKPTDGAPSFAAAGAAPRAPRPCPLGIGTRGGRSRGAGSGSRMRLWICGCAEGTPGRKVRVASDEWDATCNRCGSRYSRA